MSSRFTQAFICTLANADGVTAVSPQVKMDGTQAATTGAQTYTPIFAKDVDAYSFQYTTGAGSTLVGTLTIQGSNDPGNTEGSMTCDATVANWTTISVWDQGAGAQAASKAVATGANSLMLGDRYCLYRWIRLQFAFTSGSGSPRITWQPKGWP